jgi:hypothetical protein
LGGLLGGIGSGIQNLLGVSGDANNATSSITSSGNAGSAFYGSSPLTTRNASTFNNSAPLPPPIKPISARPPGFATGGFLPQQAGVDTVPAMLSGGEFVMNNSAVNRMGLSNLQEMNAGGDPSTADSKESNKPLLEKLEELVDVSKGKTGDVTINVTTNNNGKKEESESSDSGGSKDPEEQKRVARLIKEQVLLIINEEQRLGGSLRRRND